MKIREAVLEMLRERFKDRPFLVADDDSSVIASLDAPYPELGRLVIEDDGDEVTVYVGATHGHFNAFHEPDEQQPVAIADLLGNFLEDLFSDQVVIYSTRFTHGWRGVGDEKIVKQEARSQFFWSRPVV